MPRILFLPHTDRRMWISTFNKAIANMPVTRTGRKRKQQKRMLLHLLHEKKTQEDKAQLLKLLSSPHGDTFVKMMLIQRGYDMSKFIKVDE